MVVRVVEIIETELFVKVDHFYRDAHHENGKTNFDFDLFFKQRYLFLIWNFWELLSLSNSYLQKSD